MSLYPVSVPLYAQGEVSGLMSYGAITPERIQFFTTVPEFKSDPELFLLKRNKLGIFTYVQFLNVVFVAPLKKAPIVVPYTPLKIQFSNKVLFWVVEPLLSVPLYTLATPVNPDAVQFMKVLS